MVRRAKSRFAQTRDSCLAPSHTFSAGASACSGSPCSPGSYGKAGMQQTPHVPCVSGDVQETKHEECVLLALARKSCVLWEGQGRRGRRTRCSAHLAKPDSIQPPQVRPSACTCNRACEGGPFTNAQVRVSARDGLDGFEFSRPILHFVAYFGVDEAEDSH